MQCARSPPFRLEARFDMAPLGRHSRAPRQRLGGHSVTFPHAAMAPMPLGRRSCANSVDARATLELRPELTPARAGSLRTMARFRIYMRARHLLFDVDRRGTRVRQSLAALRSNRCRGLAELHVYPKASSGNLFNKKRPLPAGSTGSARTSQVGNSHPDVGSGNVA